MPKSGSCETPYEKRQRELDYKRKTQPARPITTEEEEGQKANEILMKMTSNLNPNVEIQEIERVELEPKPFEIAPDNPERRLLEEHLKKEQEKKSFKFCPHCGGNLDYKLD